MEVLGDDLLFEPVCDGGLVLLFLGLDPLEDGAVGESLAAADERGVEIEQGLERGDKEGTRAAGGV